MPVDMELLTILAFSFLTTFVVAAAIGGIILLRPITRHLGQYLEAKAKAGPALGGRSPEEMERVFNFMEGISDRLELLEERQDFTEKLLSKPRDGESRD